jgi:hypothetical protein
MLRQVEVREAEEEKGFHYPEYRLPLCLVLLIQLRFKLKEVEGLMSHDSPINVRYG